MFLEGVVPLSQLGVMQPRLINQHNLLDEV